MIVTRGLTKRYGKMVALNDLSFTVSPGVVTGLLGPNGSGKSTTMRMVLGLDVPEAGSASVNGSRYADLSWPLREVGRPSRCQSGAFLVLFALLGLGTGTVIRHTAGAIAVFAGCTLLASIQLTFISEGIARFAPELIFATSVAAVVRQPNSVSVTIGVVLMLAYCASALGLGAFVLTRRDA